MKKRMFYNVVDCEHEGDVFHDCEELRKLGAEIIGTQYRTDEDGEISGCTIELECDEADVEKLTRHGAWTW